MASGSDAITPPEETLAINDKSEEVPEDQREEDEAAAMPAIDMKLSNVACPFCRALSHCRWEYDMVANFMLCFEDMFVF